MDEAEELADRIAVIAGGRIVAEGTPGTLGGRNRDGGDDPLHAAGREPARTTCRPSCARWSAGDDGQS